MSEPWRVFVGGLMRCCLSTLDDLRVSRSDEPHDGEKLPCRYCDNVMIFSAGAWRWDRPEYDVFMGTGS